MLGYELEEERREDRPREPRYDAEDEPVDVEGDSLGWPDAVINVDGTVFTFASALDFSIGKIGRGLWAACSRQISE